MKLLLAILAILTLFFLSKNILNFMFSLENYNVHKKRLKQLQFNNKKEEADMSEIIDKVTQPAIRYILPKLKPKNLEQLERDLKMAKWDKHFTPVQYRALSITLKIVGLLAGLVLYNVSSFIALIWAVVLIFGIDFLLRNSKNNRKRVQRIKQSNDFPRRR